MTVPMYIKLRRDLQSKSREEKMDGVQPVLGSDSGEFFRGDLVDALGNPCGVWRLQIFD